MRIADILDSADGPEKTAELVAWIQGLFEDDVPVLVGGAAVELLTGGAYTTGDLDFVGRVPKQVERKLESAGFERKGRHWVHEAGRVFVEFPGDQLPPGEESIELEIAGRRLRILAPEAILVDRLAAWEFWQSSTDGANAYLVLRAVGNRLDRRKLEQLARAREVDKALNSLRAFARRFPDSDPAPEELARWAERQES